ncbi:MAG: DUF4288 domain-containing protein [Ruminococcus sp.]|nr:DUF4288 domain-containing protein [Ruminococcus sp.]
MTYGIKVMYTYSVEDNYFYEESILSLQADSFNEALNKAEVYAKEREVSYINFDDKTVQLIKSEVVDSFLVYEDDKITEVYSSFCINKSEMNDNDFYIALTSVADVKELYPLRHK